MLELSPTTDTPPHQKALTASLHQGRRLEVERQREEGASFSLPCRGPGSQDTWVQVRDLGHWPHPRGLSFLTCTRMLAGSSSKIKDSLCLPQFPSRERLLCQGGGGQGEFRASHLPRMTAPMWFISPRGRSCEEARLRSYTTGVMLREGLGRVERPGHLKEKVHLLAPCASHSSLGTSTWLSLRLVLKTEARNGLPPQPSSP